MVGVLRNYCNRERQTSDLCKLLVDAQMSPLRLVSRQPLERYSRAKKLDFGQAERLVSAYLGGESIAAIAKELGVHRTTVADHLTRAGIEKRSKSMSSAQIEEAVQDYVAGQSLEKIGKRLSFDSTTVLKELRLRGVQMRDTHGRERL